MRLSNPRARAARSRSIVLALACVAGARAGAQAPARPTPETTYGVHVFNDQIAPGLSPAQIDFCARRYAGTQKQTRADADRYRAVNPDFLVLHYRLGQGLGYRVTSVPCNPNGPMNQIIDGTWVQEWPGDSVVQERWFWHLNGQRVLQCQWGWYLADTDDAAWRRWWSERILAELAHNDDDGLFADSFLVPNFMGGFQPAPPSYDPAWESAWSRKMERFMDFMRERFEGRYRFVPNVGTWVTTRDTTDFSHADGVMIEGFGWDVWEQYGLEAFTAQSDRLLALTAQDKIVIGQCESIWSPEARLYSLANYLLIQGRHTFLNFEIGQDPEWWPEYDVPIGAPLADPPSSTAGLWDPAKGVYTRPFSNGHVYLNAGHTTRTFALDAVYHRALPVGGGELPWEGVPPSSWRVDYVPVSSLTLAPGGAAVVVIDPTPHELVPDVVFAGQQATLRVRNATPGSSQHFFVARGAGSTARPELGVTLGLGPPRLGAVRTADAQGNASWTFTLPPDVSGGWLSFQTAEVGSATQVVRVHVH